MAYRATGVAGLLVAILLAGPSSAQTFTSTPTCPDLDSDGLCDDADPDRDGDGVADIHDLAPADPWRCADQDSDGCDDCAVLGPLSAGGDPRGDGPDADQDGVCDATDWDDDNDGVADGWDSAPTDPYVCVDLDEDGCDDCAVRGPDRSGGDPLGDGPDFDRDGQCDAFDLDDDADGVADEEDSAPLSPLVCRDVDEDGCDDCVYTGADGSGGDPLRDGPDLDGDGICDLGDIDADGDGISDEFDMDDDGDGVFDEQETILGISADQDGDGIINRLDLDSDGDGISDLVEAGGVDADNDGRVDDCVDVQPRNGACDVMDRRALPWPDTDLDGLPDALDRDADGDGLTDASESGRADTNGDGLPDVYADYNHDGRDDHGFFSLPDTDADGVWDGRSLDADGDGLPDAMEAFIVGADGRAQRAPWGRDADRDGIDDAVDPSEGGVAAPRPDFDRDGAIDACDVDSDGDGVPDLIECAGQIACVDRDSDGLRDHLDLDSDADGRPDLQEAYDFNADGLADRSPSGADADLNGLDDAFDADLDLSDLDGDGLPDLYDPDDDGDGIPSAVERADEAARGQDLDGDGRPADLDDDADGDGAPDRAEGREDRDGNGHLDYLDPSMVVPEVPTGPVGGPDAGPSSPCTSCTDGGPGAAPGAGAPVDSGCAAVSGSSAGALWLLFGLGLLWRRRAH